MKKVSSSCLILRGKILIIFLVLMVLAFALLFYSNAAVNGARRGIGYCLNILIPSLFPFMVLSTYLIKCGISEKIGHHLGGITHILFGLPGCTAPTILMSLIGGYPVGARGISVLLKEGNITEKQAQRMLCFCVNSGPAFVISAVGGVLLRNVKIGIILFASQIAAALFLGILCRFQKEAEEVFPKRSKTSSSDSPFIFSTADAAKGILNMCAFVVLFAVLLSLLQESGVSQLFTQLLVSIGVPFPIAASFLSAFLEVTSGCSDAAALMIPPSLISFILGWGGLCVHFQVFSCLTQIHIPRFRFILFRLLHGFFAAIFTQILFYFFPVSIQVFGNVSEPLSSQFSVSAPAAAALILLCIVFLCSIGKSSGRKKICGVL